jgi:hypothetical protein
VLRLAETASCRQRLEQYLTLSQFLAQALRHTISRVHHTHGFIGNVSFLWVTHET